MLMIACGKAIMDRPLCSVLQASYSIVIHGHKGHNYVAYIEMSWRIKEKNLVFCFTGYFMYCIFLK